MHLLRQAKWFFKYWRLFGSLGDVSAYRLLRKHPERWTGLVPLRLRPAGGAVLHCRPGTTDALVLLDTFLGQFHLPPVDLRADATILDLGANAGYTAAHLAALYPRARIYAVELDGGNYELARRNLACFGSRCEVVRGAIWSEDGEVQYSGAQEWDYRVCQLSPDKQDRAHDAARPMDGLAPAFTIETLMGKYGIDTVDFVKMDIEGAEAAVVTPDAAWLSKVRSLTLEIHKPATLEGCSRVLTGAGFRCEQHAVHRYCIKAFRP